MNSPGRPRFLSAAPWSRRERSWRPSRHAPARDSAWPRPTSGWAGPLMRPATWPKPRNVSGRCRNWRSAGLTTSRQSAPARDMLGSSYLRLARIRRNSREFAEAGVAYRQAIAIARALWTAEPKNIVYKTHLAHAAARLGIFLDRSAPTRRGAAAVSRIGAPAPGTGRSRSRGPGGPGLACPRTLPPGTAGAE